MVTSTTGPEVYYISYVYIYIGIVAISLQSYDHRNTEFEAFTYHPGRRLNADINCDMYRYNYPATYTDIDYKAQSIYVSFKSVPELFHGMTGASLNIIYIQLQ